MHEVAEVAMAPVNLDQQTVGGAGYGAVFVCVRAD